MNSVVSPYVSRTAVITCVHKLTNSRPSKRMVLITCVRKVMRLTSLGLKDYHVKIEFLQINVLSSSFFNKFDRIICISIEHTY